MKLRWLSSNTYHCEKCDVDKTWTLYSFVKTNDRGHTFSFEYDLSSQMMTVWDLDSRAEDKIVFKTNDLFLITPKNALKKLPLLIVFS